MKTVVTFQIKNETKGAVRFEEVDATGQVKDFATATIGSLYVRKSAIKGAIPQKLTVTVEAA